MVLPIVVTVPFGAKRRRSATRVTSPMPAVSDKPSLARILHVRALICHALPPTGATVRRREKGVLVTTENLRDGYVERDGRRPLGLKTLLIALTFSAMVLAVGQTPVLAQTVASQHFTVVSAGPPGAPRTVIARGVLNSVGTEVIESNPEGVSTVRWIFPEGTVFVRNTYTADIAFDPVSCLRTITLSGRWEVTGGTGLFSGASGSGTFSGPNRILLTRTPQGCATPPVFLVQLFQFTGHLGLGSEAAA